MMPRSDLIEALRRHAWDDCDSAEVPTHIASQAAAEIERLLDLLYAVNTRISAIQTAFGAPGDYGYDSREGQALLALYQLRAVLPWRGKAEAPKGGGDA